MTPRPRWQPPRALLRGLAAATFAVVLAGCKVGLYSGLNEPEANEMVAVLTAEGIDADKQRLENSEWQVLVGKRDLPASLELLRAHGLPNDRLASMGDVFQKQGLVSTPSEDRMRYIFAMSQELAKTLRKVDGVVAARVHVVVPASDPLSDKVRPSSAAVFIKHRADVDLRPLVPAVKDLVSHSIEGLSHEHVSLSLFEARLPPARAPAPGTTASRADLLGLGDLAPATIAAVVLLLAAGAACVVALPGLLRRSGQHAPTWLRKNVLRR